jgi:recombinational DNA repair protein (RecF pathway)
MAYDVYTLSGYVINVRESGEYDKTITFFSKENGIIDVKAISAGKSTSKMRGFLIRFCCLDIDIVHGKTGYRLTRARSLGSGFLIHKKEVYFLLTRFQKFIILLLPNETPHPGVFMVFSQLMDFLEKNIITDLDIDQLYYEYSVLVLTELGYRENKILNKDLKNLKKEYDFILYENGIQNMI